MNDMQQILYCQQYCPSTMNTQSSLQSVRINIYDFIQINPSTILNLFFDEQHNRIYVSRQKYSQIYQISQTEQPPVLQQIAELEPSLYFINVAGILALFKPFQLQIFRNGKWQYHSFTTQLLSIRIVNHSVYSFHQKQTILWNFEEDYFTYQFLTQANTPYHLDSEGSIVGYGRKIKQINKGSKLIRCEVIENNWVFVGDDKGYLHVYEWTFLSHVKSFHEHQAPILAITASAADNTVYFTGSDSKISLIRLISNEWQLGQCIRGQSHDIFSLALFGQYLVSGGVTTDFCFYSLESGEFTGDFVHKVSYCCAKRIANEGKFVIVNNRDSFEIWQIGVNLHRTNLLVRYEMPVEKFIIDCKVYRQEIEEKTLLVLVVTDEDTVGWKFSAETGLTKYITIQNQYALVELLPKHIFLGVRRDGLIEKVNCTNGKIEEISYSQVQLPTDLKHLGKGIVLVASKITGSLNLVSMRSKQIVSHYSFKNTFAYIDHIEQNQLLVQYFNNPSLYKLDLGEFIETEIARLPVSIVRFGGWVSSVTKLNDKQVKSKVRKYWYGVSEGKIVIIPNIQKQGKKKIRVKQTQRIAQVIGPSLKSLGCNLAIIPYNFSKMMDELPIKPIFTKKIV